MLRTGDIVKSPWGCGVVLENTGTTGGAYILWVGFNAHGFGRAQYRVENVYPDEESVKYIKKCGKIPAVSRIISEIRAVGGFGGEQPGKSLSAL